jgi:hypothetical protein
MRLRARIPATRRLQYQTEDVAGDEDARVVFGRDAGVVSAKSGGYLAQAEVQAGGVEGRGDS